MDAHADLVAYDRSGLIRVLVEVKNKPVSSVTWAKDFRRNVLAHGVRPRADYFIVATPTMLHVWKEPAEPNAAPSVSVNARDLWERYSGGRALGPGSGEAFELVVASWLTDVALRWPAIRQDSELRGLEETGLPDAIRGGRVEHGIAA